MANDQVTLRIGADSSGLRTGLNQSSAAVNAFGTRTTAVFSKLNARLDNAADRALTPMTGLITGGGIAMAAKSVNDTELSLVRLGNQAGWSYKKMAEVQAQVYASSKRTGVPINELISGMTTFVDKTGDADMAVALLGDTAMATTASGAGFADMGAIAAQLDQKFKVSSKDLGEWFEIISAMGDKGAFTMADMSTNAERLFSSFASAGASKENLRSYLAMVQIARQSTGSSEQATTAIESTFNTFRQKATDIKKLAHFDIFDKKGQMKDAETILKALYKYTQGSSKLLSKFGFDAQALRFIQDFLRQRKETGNYDFLNSLKNAAPDAKNMATLQEKFNKAMHTGAYQTLQFKTALQETMNTGLSGPIKEGTKLLADLAEHQKMVTAGFYLIAAAAGTLGMVKLGRLGNEARSFVEDLRGAGKTKPSAGGPEGGPLQGQLGVQRVFVVNWQNGNLSVSSIDKPVLYGADGRPITDSVREFGSEVTKATGKFAAARAGLNSALSTNLGFGALSAATGWAVSKILEAGDLLKQWHDSRNDAKKVISDNRLQNYWSMESKYGTKAAGIGRQIDAVDDQIAKERDSFFGPDLEMIDRLESKRSALYQTMYKAQEENRQRGPLDKNAELKQAITIFVDSRTGKSVVESSPSEGPINFGSPSVTTKPWLKPGTYTGG